MLTLMAMVLIAVATSAHAVVVNIDSSQSSVTYDQSSVVVICDLQGVCIPSPDPQIFILSGSFDVI
ncbi:MAG: hypothetical protein J0I90_05620, partial [Nitrosospira sp.]|nr:hypothetical protein [Nitrosospira sp.]